MTRRPVPQKAVSFTSGKEGLRLTAYPDQGGTWTIGYGTTSAITPVHKGMVITRAQALSYLTQALDSCADKIASVLKPDILGRLTDNQYTVLLDFVYNLAFDRSNTIWSVLNAGNFDAAPTELQRFIYVTINGKKVKSQGLINRRAAEVALWHEEDPTVALISTQSSLTQVAETPAVPVAKPAGTSKTLITTVGSGLLAVPPLAKKGIDIVTPWAAHSHYLDQAITYLATAGGVAAVAAGGLIAYKQWKARK